jgi:hypothetical protein
MKHEYYENGEEMHDTGLNCYVEKCIYVVGIIVVVVILIGVYLLVH